jgi:hypothetical protein
MKPKLPYLSFEKDYLLLNEILELFRKYGMMVTSTGSEERGNIPLYEFQIGTARLHFGTLVGLLNNPEKYEVPQGQIRYLHDYKTKREDVTEIRYTWYEVSSAVDTLASRFEVEKEIQGQFVNTQSKIIKLTKKGFQSLNTKKYIKKYETERNDRVLYESTLSTNKWMKWFTGVLALSAILTLITQLSTCNQNKLLPMRVLCPPSPQIQKIDSPTKRSLSQEHNKEWQVNLKTDSTKNK